MYKKAGQPFGCPAELVCLENGHNSAGVGLVNVVLDLLAGQSLQQSLGLLGVFVALLDHQHIGIGLGGDGVGIFGGNGVGTGVQTGVQGVVAVDDGHGDAGQGLGQLSGLDLTDGDVDVVALNVLNGGVGGGGDAVLQGDEALLLQQEQGAGLVGAVVGDVDLVAVLEVRDGGDLAGVDAEGLIVDGGVILSAKKELDLVYELSLLIGKVRGKKNPQGYVINTLKGKLKDKKIS